jgi:hypothetical protein
MIGQAFFNEVMLYWFAVQDDADGIEADDIAAGGSA